MTSPHDAELNTLADDCPWEGGDECDGECCCCPRALQTARERALEEAAERAWGEV